jgi:hypothetical protein
VAAVKKERHRRGSTHEKFSSRRRLQNAEEIRRGAQSTFGVTYASTFGQCAQVVDRVLLVLNGTRRDS